MYEIGSDPEIHGRVAKNASNAQPQPIVRPLLTMWVRMAMTRVAILRSFGLSGGFSYPQSLSELIPADVRSNHAF